MEQEVISLTARIMPLTQITVAQPAWLYASHPSRSKTHRTKVHMTAIGSAAKKVLDYVIRRLNALSAELKGRLGGLTFAETPLSAISRFNWSPESTEARRLFKAPREDDSSFRADLEQSTPNKGVYEIR